MSRSISGALLFALILALGSQLGLGQKQAAREAVFSGHTTTVAARWYQRSRQGQLHRRSTPAGRSIPHTIRPVSIKQQSPGLPPKSVHLQR